MVGMDHDNQHAAKGMDSQQLLMVSIDGESLSGEALLSATQRQ
jgi:hypothetical protein